MSEGSFPEATILVLTLICRNTEPGFPTIWDKHSCKDFLSVAKRYAGNLKASAIALKSTTEDNVGCPPVLS